MNKIILLGRLGKDAETFTFDNGDKISKFSLATSESWKDKQSGEWKDHTEWHSIVVRGERSYSKGELVLVEGKIRYKTYEKDGKKTYFTEVKADSCRRVSGAENRPTPEGDNLPVEDTNTSNADITPEEDLPF